MIILQQEPSRSTLWPDRSTRSSFLHREEYQSSSERPACEVRDLREVLRVLQDRWQVNCGHKFPIARLLDASDQTRQTFRDQTIQTPHSFLTVQEDQRTSIDRPTI